MKKIILVVVGLVVVISAGILISRPEKSGKPDGLERTQGSQETESMGSTVSQAARLPGGDESRRDGGDTGKRGGDVASAEAVLTDPVKVLLGLDGKKHNYPSLLSAINDLGDELSATDLAALMDMLNFPNDRFPEKMRPIEINAVKNDVLDKLLSQKQLPEGLGLQMVEMAGNTENDPVWRDYCIQFMTPFYERAAEEAQTEQFTDELSAVHDAMFTALDERDTTLAGTSLIGLELLSRTHDEFDRELIVEKSVEIASDEMASPACRMTALRLAVMTGESESAVDAARSLAQTGETVLLRSSAIVTLGEVGTGADRELLVSYTTDDNQQIAEAATLALQKMDQEPATELEVASKPVTEPQVTEKLPPVLIN